MTHSPDSLRQTIAASADHLRQYQEQAGLFRGRLSSSPLATAVAICALDQADDRDLIARAVGQLIATQNDNGGFGDTGGDPSNLAATLLAWCALSRAEPGQAASAEAALRGWLTARAGGANPSHITAALARTYGDDRTFAAPILTCLAIHRRLGPAESAWSHVPQLPMELALLPHRLLAAASLPVVSYAIPALIAVGLARHVRRPSRCPLTRPLRNLLTPSLLDKLTRIQPTSGGFLEAPPLTGFVTMCLAAVGRGDHPVARRGRTFLRRSASAEATWPIDIDLAHWLTSQAASALARADLLDDTARATLSRCIQAGQFRKPHPATQSPPGGWGWTDRSGALPDTDDTAAALLALRTLHPPAGPAAAEVLRSARLGCEWLLRVQNADGGFPTFCSGWGRLDFDASCCDLTAHAIAALAAWSALLPARAKRACLRGLRFLVRSQRPDGSLLALWFGRANTPDQHNPVFGTARVLQHLRDASVSLDLARAKGLCARAEAYLISVQHDDGSWGASAGTSPSIEETASATAALAGHPAAVRGAAWLVERTDGGTIFPAEVIGLYFARLWYAETLYPVIFTLDALTRVQHNRPRL